MTTVNDPLYRLIELPSLIDQIDGSFQKGLIGRLSDIRSLGMVAWSHGTAQYPKSEHRYGTIHQVNQMVEMDWFPVMYRIPMLLSAAFLHTGHFPFTYASERAFLRAAGQNDEAEEKVKQIIEKVCTAIDNDESAKGILTEFMDFKRRFELYRWFSAWHLLERQSAIFRILHSEVKGNEEALIEAYEADDRQSVVENIYNIAVSNLVDRNSDGYKYLTAANKADYVQRDGLYFGTVRLDISARHLYRADFVPPTEEVDEWQLIERNLEYLRRRIYNAPISRAYGSLWEHLLGNFICGRDFRLEWLWKWTDDKLLRLVQEASTGESRANYSETLIGWGNKYIDGEYSPRLLLHLKNICHEKSSSEELEGELIEASGRGKLQYPFKRHILLDCRNAERRLPVTEDRTYYDVALYLLKGLKRGRRLFECLGSLLRHYELGQLSAIQQSIGAILCGQETCRIDVSGVERALVEAMQQKCQHNGGFQDLYRLRDKLNDLQWFRSLRMHFQNHINLSIVPWLIEQREGAKNRTVPRDGLRSFVNTFMALPRRGLSLSCVRDIIVNLENTLWSLYRGESETENGELFEAICLLERLLKGPRRDDKSLRESWLYISNLVKQKPDDPDNRAKSQEDNQEFDIIEVFVEDRQLYVEVREASIKCSQDKKEEEREKMIDLTDEIREIFHDAKINTYWLRPCNSNEVQEEHAYTVRPRV